MCVVCKELVLEGGTGSCKLCWCWCREVTVKLYGGFFGTLCLLWSGYFWYVRFVSAKCSTCSRTAGRQLWSFSASSERMQQCPELKGWAYPCYAHYHNPHLLFSPLTPQKRRSEWGKKKLEWSLCDSNLKINENYGYVPVFFFCLIVWKVTERQL